MEISEKSSSYCVQHLIIPPPHPTLGAWAMRKVTLRKKNGKTVSKSHTTLAFLKNPRGSYKFRRDAATSGWNPRAETWQPRAAAWHSRTATWLPRDATWLPRLPKEPHE